MRWSIRWCYGQFGESCAEHERASGDLQVKTVSWRFLLLSQSIWHGAGSARIDIEVQGAQGGLGFLPKIALNIGLYYPRRTCCLT